MRKHFPKRTYIILIIRREGPVSQVPFRGLRGTSGYFAPEQIAGKDYGFPVDMFAFGGGDIHASGGMNSVTEIYLFTIKFTKT